MSTFPAGPQVFENNQFLRAGGNKIFPTPEFSHRGGYKEVSTFPAGPQVLANIKFLKAGGNKILPTPELRHRDGYKELSTFPAGLQRFANIKFLKQEKICGSQLQNSSTGADIRCPRSRRGPNICKHQVLESRRK